MQEINNNQIEKALLMYKETVSPSKDSFKMIISQIPEQKLESVEAIRSPYIWVVFAELAMLCSILVAIIPTLVGISDDPFYQVDRNITNFELQIQNQDYQDVLQDATL